MSFEGCTKKKGEQFFFSKIGIFRGIISFYVTKKNILFFFWNLKIQDLTEILIYFTWLWDIGKWNPFVKHILRLKCNHDLRLGHMYVELNAKEVLFTYLFFKKYKFCLLIYLKKKYKFCLLIYLKKNTSFVYLFI